jgi:hypothetical protein
MATVREASPPPYFESKLLTFTGAAGLGEVANPTCTVFTVTGEVLIERIVPYCTVDLVSAGGGNLLTGIVGSTSLFLASTVATAIDAGEFHVNTTPVAAGVALPAAFKDIIITADIVATVDTADITAGAIRYDVWWRPLSADGNVAAA